MAHVTYDQPHTALLVIDPYNDFISVGGQVWDRPKTLSLQGRSHSPRRLR